MSVLPKWAGLLTLALSGACAAATAASPQPARAQLEQAYAPDYRPTPGSAPECLGRLVFDVPARPAWPDHFNNNTPDPFYGEFAGVGRREGVNIIQLGQVRVARWAMADGLAARAHAHALRRQARLRDFQIGADAAQRDIDHLTRLRPVTPDTERALIQSQQTAADVRRRITGFDQTWKTLEVGLPDSYAVQEGSYAALYLQRGAYVFAFDLGPRNTKAVEPETGTAALIQEMIGVAQRFRVRAEHEIPTDLGLCVPGGFVADDGRTPFHLRQDMRFADAPGVFYGISTGNAAGRHRQNPAWMQAVTRPQALKGMTGQNLGDRQVLKREQIGPAKVRIGALPASQGGLALTLRQDTCSVTDAEDKRCPPEKYPDPFEMYAVYTGYEGWAGSAVLPEISVEMSTVSRLDGPGLVVDPPPFAQSKARLDALLASIRLRRTSTPMPEFQSARP